MSATDEQRVEQIVEQLAGWVSEQNFLLRRILAGIGADVELGISDSQLQESELQDWPYAGGRRQLIRRSGAGGDTIALAVGAPLLLVAPNEARLGLDITNQGAGAVILYLADRVGSGLPAIYLPAGVGWDGRVSDRVWCGNVTASAVAAASISWAEL